MTEYVDIANDHIRLSRSVKPNALIRIAAVHVRHLGKNYCRPDGKSAKYTVIQTGAAAMDQQCFANIVFMTLVAADKSGQAVPYEHQNIPNLDGQACRVDTSTEFLPNHFAICKEYFKGAEDDEDSHEDQDWHEEFGKV